MTNVPADHPDVFAQMREAWAGRNQCNIAPLWHGSPTKDPSAPPKKDPKK